MEVILQLFILIFGFLLLVKGADFFVDGSSKIAKKFGISELIIGLTIVAMGTSAPETAVSIAAALKGTADISIGNVVGSNILNILIILGMSALITKIKIEKSTLFIEIPYMLLASVVLLIIGKSQQTITIQEGLILIMMFILYLLYLFWLSQKENEEEIPPQYSFLGCLLLIVLGILFVMIGSQLVVKAATQIAHSLHLSQRFIGLTIVAFGTSLPELVTSLQAARKNNAGIAIGNIVGSNIFNILFIVGGVSLICPVPFESKFIVDTFVAIGSGCLLWLLTIYHHELNRISGLLMLFFYVMYLIYLC